MIPGVVVFHHMPGWDDWSKEVVRKLAFNGYATISPHLLLPARAGEVGWTLRRPRGRRGSPSNLEGVMCRGLVSVDWEGYIYDCDFNQMLGLPLRLRSGSKPRQQHSPTYGSTDIQETTGTGSRTKERIHLRDLVTMGGRRARRQPHSSRGPLLRLHGRPG